MSIAALGKSIVAGEIYEYKLVRKTPGLTDFFFQVLQNGISTGHVIKANLYGPINVPIGSGISIPNEDRNKLAAFTSREYKRGMSF